MSIHSRLCRIYDFLWIYWGWLWGNERNIIEINIADNGDIQEGEAEYFSALLKENLGKIKKGRIYPVPDQPNVYVKANRSFIRFADPDDGNRHIYQSLDAELGSGWHGRVKRSSIGFRVTSDDACVITMVDGPSKVIKKQRARSLSFRGLFSKSMREIEQESEWNKRLYVPPSEDHKCIQIKKTHYGMDSYFGYTLMPELPGTPLDKYLARNQVEVNVKFTILINTLRALEMLELRGIAHCDLKSGNIMINDDLSVNLFDFCTVTEYDKYPPYPWALPGFRSHTPYRFEVVSAKFDIYSFGVMAKAMLPDSVWSSEVDSRPLSDILNLMLSSDPNVRPTRQEIINAFCAVREQIACENKHTDSPCV